MNLTKTYDVVIIGAGVAGCSTAIALKNQNPDLSILIIERNTIQNKLRRIGETLPPQASKQLQQLGIWNDFLKCNFNISYGTSAAWGNSQLYTNEFMYTTAGYGWNLDRDLFDQFMITQAKQRGVEFSFETSCILAQEEAKIWKLLCNTTKQKITLLSHFVVDATGKKAAFSTQIGNQKIIADQLVGIYNFYQKKQKSSDIIGNGTCVEAAHNGWWYSATLPNNILVVGYMTDADISNKFKLNKPQEFNHLLAKTQYTVNRLNHATVIDTPRVVAAHTQCLKKSVGNAWLAVGDAATSYDPISSLGIYKSLITSQFASFAIIDYLKNNHQGLQKYEYIISQDYQAYLNKKTTYYNQEKRFKEELFWQRRQNYN